MGVFEVKVKQPTSLLFDFKGATKMISAESVKAMDRAVTVIQTNVTKEAPVGVSSDLRSSIDSKVIRKPSEIVGIVFAGKKYSLAVNNGRKASPVSATGQLSLKRWVEKSSAGRSLWTALRSSYPKITSKQVAFLVARKKKQKATKGQEFFDKGVELSINEVRNIFKSLNITVARKLS